MQAPRNRLIRTLRHLWFDAGDARRLIGPDGLARLQQRIVDSERLHSGEIRICVEGGLPMSYLRRGASARERAVMVFGKLRVWDTEHNNGVLIYLLVAEHRIEIVADRGLNARVPASHWAGVTTRMAEAFRAGRFTEGLESAVEAVHAELVRHFSVPEHAVNANELPDVVVLL